MDQDPVTVLVGQMTQPDEDKRQQAMDALIEMGQAAVGPLLTVMADKEQAANVRYRTALILGRIGTVPAVDYLLRALTGRDAATVSYAAAAMEEVTNPEAVELLLKFLGHSDDFVRQLVIGALGRTHAQEAVTPLIDALADPNRLVRCNSVWALGGIRSPASLEALRGCLTDPDAQVRSLAVLALGEVSTDKNEIAAPIAAMLRDADTQVRLEATGALVEMGAIACTAVMPLLEDDNITTRELAALVIRWTCDVRAVPSLLKALQDESVAVRQQAARALGRLRDKNAIGPLRDLLTDPDDRIRQTAEMSLKKLGFHTD